jgi:glycosyltransferase involved in cell wall biosynthesis
MNGDSNTTNLGGSRKSELIFSALANSGHNVLVLSFAMLSNSRIGIRRPQREFIQLDGGKKVRIEYPAAFMLRPFGGVINCVRARSIVKKLIRDFDPHVAIVYNPSLFQSLASMELTRADIPIILEIEDLPLARFRGLLNIKPRLDQMCWGLMLQKASAFTAVNQPIYDLLPPGKPRLLLPGIIDQDLIECSQKRRKPFRGEKRCLGYFGALTREKGVDLLLDLVPRLDSPWQLVVTGSGPLAASLERLGSEFPDRMRFLGGVDKRMMYEAMCSCDCLLIPRENITNDGQGVFPFKTYEYVVSGAHIISVALPPNNLANNASFFQRWDGTLSSLLILIDQSQYDYEKEQEQRTELTNFIIDNFSTQSIVNKFDNIFNSILNYDNMA